MRVRHPALMGACAAARRSGWRSARPRGKFLARVSAGRRREMSCCGGCSTAWRTTPAQSCRMARNMIFGKVYNARWSVERTKRDHALRVDTERLSRGVGDSCRGFCRRLRPRTSLESLRGLEGIRGHGLFRRARRDDPAGRRRRFSSASAAAARRSTRSTRCSRLPIVCSRTTVPPRSRVWDWTPMSASCTATGRGASRWRST